MKKTVLILAALLILTSGCLGYFKQAEKTTKIEIKEGTVLTEIVYTGELTEKGKKIENCGEELKKVFPSARAGLEANINAPDKEKREEIKGKLELLKEIENSFECKLTKENETGEMTVKFNILRDTAKKLSKLMPGEGFVLGDINSEYFFLKMRPETKDFFALEITEENLKIKIDGKMIEIKPKGFAIKDGFVQFYETKNLDANFIEINFMKEKIPEFPFVLVAVSFIIIIGVIFIIITWIGRKPDELFPYSEKDIKERLKKKLINGLGTTQIEIVSMEKLDKGFEAEVMIKTRKYHVTFNKKMELKEYIKI